MKFFYYLGYYETKYYAWRDRFGRRANLAYTAGEDKAKEELSVTQLQVSSSYDKST